jgi:uncharacterized protein
MSDVTQEQKTMAMIAHLLGIVSWFVGPLIIWLINKDKADQEFVIDQSKEALNFQITMAIAWFACIVVAIVTLGIGSLLFPVLGIAGLIFCILAGLEANKGVAYRYPFALRLIK